MIVLFILQFILAGMLFLISEFLTISYAVFLVYVVQDIFILFVKSQKMYELRKKDMFLLYGFQLAIVILVFVGLIIRPSNLPPLLSENGCIFSLR